MNNKKISQITQFAKRLNHLQNHQHLNMNIVNNDWPRLFNPIECSPRKEFPV